MRTKTKKRIVLISLALLNIAILAFINFIGKSGIPYFIIGRIAISAVSIQGILQAIINLICIFMIFVDCNTGHRISVVFVLLSLVSNCLAILVTRDLSSLPGITTSFISLVTIDILSRYLRKNELTAITDFVTGLNNRRLFVRTLDDKIAERKPFYLCYFEITNFRHIFDNYGLMAGDDVLKAVSKRTKAQLGKNDMLFRISGSNFAVIFDGSESPKDKISKIIESCEENISLSVTKLEEENVNKFCTANMAAGISRFPDDTDDSLSLTKHADTALSYSKKDVEEKIHFFDSRMRNDQLMQIEAEKLIKESIEKDRFYLVYQPQYEMASKKLRGFETLIRCCSSEGKIISPGDFIPAAERSNLIFEIDHYVLVRAMNEFKKTCEEAKTKFTLAINVSAKTFASVGFVDELNGILKETGFNPEYLEIEITEYSLAESQENTTSNIMALRKKGIQIALDDFGTGYTSIAQLMKLPVNLLKIDKSLIDDIESNAMNRDLVDSVIYMGHIMNCEVISEGVENDTQLELLKQHNCDFVQGFVWGRPLEFSEAVKLALK